MAQEMPSISLRVWKRDFGLFSVDPHCMQLLTLFRINRIDCPLEYANVPQWGNIPSLTLDDVVYSNVEDLIPMAFEIWKLDGDTAYGPVRANRLIVYENYFLNTFVIALYFDRWYNDSNFEVVTKPWFKKVIPIPFNYLYVRHHRKLAITNLKSVAGYSSWTAYEAKLHANTNHCLSDLNNFFLDGRPFLFGDLPSSLDVTVYSYLVVAMKLPHPDRKLANIINQYQLLTRFVSRMTQTYFPDMLEDDLEVSDPNNSERASKKTICCAIAIAAGGMFLYAMNCGLISKPAFLN